MKGKINENRLKAILLIAVFILSTITLATPIVSAAGITYYVDASRPDDTGDGTTLATAEKTIQAGIDDAGVDDIVLVAAGTYAPSAMLNGFSAGVTLRGDTDDPATVIITGSALSGTHMINVHADDLTIEGFNLVHTVVSVDALWIRSNTNDVIIRDNIFDGNDWAIQIEPGGATGATISDNIINSDMSIQAWKGTNGLTISNNMITDDYTTSNGVGITLWGGATGLRTEDNTITGNTILGKNEWGIIFAISGSDNFFDRTVISDNYIYGTVGSPGHGIELRAAAEYVDIAITGNTIIDNTGDGIFVGEMDVWTTSSINYNRIMDNGGEQLDNDETTGTIDAEMNYWGANTAAGIAALITGANDITPWIFGEDKGDILAISGTGETAGSTVSVFWDAAVGAGALLLNTTEANPDGTWDLDIEIPADVEGLHYTWVETADSTDMYSTVWVIPKVSLSPKSGLSGDEVTVTGSGYSAESEMIITWDYDGGSPAVLSTSIETDELGSFTYDFDVPASMGYNDDYTVHGIDESLWYAAYDFTVGASSPSTLKWVRRAQWLKSLALAT